MYGMTDKEEKQFIELFEQGLEGWSYREWYASSAMEKENVLWYALHMGPEVDEELVTDLFWDWVRGLDETYFEDYEEETVEEPENLFDAVLPVVRDWFGTFMGDEDCENIAQTFAMEISMYEDYFDILNRVCDEYDLSQDAYEGICADLELLNLEHRFLD